MHICTMVKNRKKKKEKRKRKKELDHFMALFTMIIDMASFLALMSLSLSLIVNGVEARRDFHNLELDRQVMILNKPHIMSIKTEDGDIFDCVDIYKQPAFDHPLLKNHKIQIKPSSLPKETAVSESSASTKDVKLQDFGIKGGGCPSGTVPIRRTHKEDLIRARSFMESQKTKIYGTNVIANAGVHHVGKVLGSKEKEGYSGASSFINTQNPLVSNKQYSAAITLMQNGTSIDQLDTIKFGWMVNPALYGNNKTYTFGAWTSINSRGCFDIMCPGFVQVSSSTPIHQVLDKVSVVGGDQFEVRFTVTKDKQSGNWMLYFGDNTHIGYWPSSIFTFLSRSSAQSILWGGEAYTDMEDFPPMGSGYFPEAGEKKAAYFRDIKVAYESNDMVSPKEALLKFYTDSPSCYNSGPWDGQSYTSFFYGGIGGKECDK